MVLYSEKINEGFRKHNRSMWHYIMSFHATAVASLLGLCLLLGAHCWFQRINPACGWRLLFLFMTVLFIAKAWLTRRDLERQELACFRLYRSHFDKAYYELSGTSAIQLPEAPAKGL
jgi:hypothetical protein